MIEARLPREVLQALPESAVERQCRVENDLRLGKARSAPAKAASLTDSGNIVATPSDIEAVSLLRRTVRERAVVLAQEMRRRGR